MNRSPRTGEARSLPSALGREALVLVAAVAFGTLAMPPLVWLAGTRAFGPYAGGGPRALVGNFFHGLAQGTLGFWLVAIGPYAIVLAARALLGFARATAAAD